MPKLTLYLFVGYPGAGKTTVAKIIAQATGAVHLWADWERHEMFGHPTHSAEESTALYEALNTRTDELLASGQSVVFDTNFNFYADREYMRSLAAKHGAETVLIWLQTPAELAKQRAVHDSNLRNGYKAIMTEANFDSIAAKLEPPTPAEHPIVLDGSQLDPTFIKQQFGL